MKKTLLSLLMFLALPLMAQVSNPSIIPVASAPSGSCSVNLPDQQVVYLGTVYTCQSGTWAELSGGGGGGTPAGANGNPQINASSSFGAAANVIYQQSGDTIASIETACSSLCTYVVTSPQTITLAASHAMNSNVWLRFEADGKWTVNGSTYVLSNVQVAPGTTTTTHFPAGTGSLTLSTLNTLVPVEWFGAVADWNGTTGTNNLTAIQNTINAISDGQAVLSGPYAIGGTLTVAASFVGIKGLPVGRGLNAQLFETVAGDPAISEVGTSGTPLIFNTFQDFSVYSSVSQTGTTAGMYFSFTGGVTVRNVNVVDFFYDFSIHASPSFGGGGFFHDVGGWSSLSSAMTNPVAFYLPSTDGVAEDSINLNYDSVYTATGGPTQPIGLLSTGTAINDQDITNFATASTNGMEFIYTGSGGADTCSDIQIVTPTIDNFPSIGVEVSGCPPAASGRVAVSGGYIMAGPSTVSTNGAVYVLNSSGFTIYGTQIGVIAPGTAATYGVNFSGSGTSGGIASNVTCMNQPNCVYWQANANNNSATGNVAINETGSAYAAAFHVGSGSSYNQISANTTVGLWTDGLILDSGVTNNTYGLNNWSSGTTTSVNDGGTGNGIGVINSASNSIPLYGGGIASSTLNEGTPQNYAAYYAIGPWDYAARNLATPTSQFSLGFGLPAGTPGTNFVISCYASSWQACLTFNTSTLAATFGGAVTAPSYTAIGSANGYFNFVYTGTPPTAPGTNTFQISPAVSVSSPWSLSPAAAPASGYMKGTNTSSVVQQSFESTINLGSSSDVSGTLITAAVPAFTGDVTSAGGALALTLAAPFKTRSCEVVFGGTGTSNVLQAGDDTIAQNSCYNEIGVTETITGVYCKSDASSSAPTVNPTFGAAGTGTSILSGALTCGTSNAYLGTTTIANGALTAGAGIDPVMASPNGTNIHMLIVYTVPN